MYFGRDSFWLLYHIAHPVYLTGVRQGNLLNIFMFMPPIERQYTPIADSAQQDRVVFGNLRVAAGQFQWTFAHTIAQIERLEHIFTLPGNRPLQMADWKAANQKHDDPYANNPRFRLSAQSTRSLRI